MEFPKPIRVASSRWMLIVAGAVLCYQVLIPPIVGLANNGDFITVMAALHLVPADAQDPDQFFAYTVPKYRPHPEPMWQSGLLISEVVLLTPAYWLNRLVFSKDGLFDIRWAGVTHSALLLLALWLLGPVLALLRRSHRIIIVAAILFVFLDVEYVSYFNTFYADPAAFLMFLLMVVMFLRIVFGGGSPGRDSIILLLCALFFVSSKMQHAPLALPLLAFLVWKNHLFELVGRRWLTWALTGMVAAGGLTMLLVTPRAYTYTALYNVVFWKILPESPTPEATLRELGLGSEDVRYRGMHAYSTGSAFAEPAWRQAFMARTSHLKLVFYYIRHPEVGLHVWKTGMAQAGSRRPVAFGDLPKSAGCAPRAKSNAFAMASVIKRRLMENRPFSALVFFLGSTGILLSRCWKIRARRPGLFEGVCLVVLMAALEMLFACVFDVLETTRHLFIYNAMVDVLFVGALTSIVVPFIPTAALPTGRTVSAG